MLVKNIIFQQAGIFIFFWAKQARRQQKPPLFFIPHFSKNPPKGGQAFFKG
jgi:hypothetical protein